jgi:benzoyl-CoA reductase/2-hydroxyglutaryl-CoA dehydratase subunit BcrC/BadD/HgdB
MVTEIIKAKAGVPTLTLDISQSGQLTNAEQSRTRIEAFMEILEHNRAMRRDVAPV